MLLMGLPAAPRSCRGKACQPGRARDGHGAGGPAAGRAGGGQVDCQDPGAPRRCRHSKVGSSAPGLGAWCRPGALGLHLAWSLGPECVAPGSCGNPTRASTPLLPSLWVPRLAVILESRSSGDRALVVVTLSWPAGCGCVQFPRRTCAQRPPAVPPPGVGPAAWRASRRRAAAPLPRCACPAPAMRSTVSPTSARCSKPTSRCGAAGHVTHVAALAVFVGCNGRGTMG